MSYYILKEDGGVLLKEDGGALLLEAAVIIGNVPGEYAFGVVAVGATPVTGLDYFEVENKSGFAIDIYIRGTDMAGGVGWTLADDGDPGADIVGFKAGLDGGDYTIVVKKNDPYNKLIAALAHGAKQKFGLKMFAPTSFSDGAVKSGTITIEGAAVV